MRYSSHDIPDLPEAAFKRGPGRSIKPQGSGGKGGSSPKTPDYMALADKDAASNMAMAKYATQANRVNQITPYGNMTWTNDRVFDQAGYDRAMQAYNQYGSTAQNNAGGYWKDVAVGPGGDYGITYEKQWIPYGSSSSSSSRSAGAAPNINDFYSGGDNWTQKIELSPEMQSILDQQMKLSQGLFGSQNAALGRVQQMMGTDFDMSKVPAAGTALDINGLPAGGQALNLNNLPRSGTALDVNSLPGAGSVYDPTQATNTATEAILSRVNPDLDRQYEALRNQLANQGITQGSAAWNNAMGEFGRQRNDAVTQAGLQGINLGMQQQGQTYNQQTQNRTLAAALQAQNFGQMNQNRQQEAALQDQQFGQQNLSRQLQAALQAQQFGQQNALRGAGMQEQAFLRSLPLNELNALRSGSQVEMPQFPGYAQQATTGGTDYTGAAQNTYQSQMAANNAAAAGQSNMMSGLFGLGQMGLMGYGMGMFSDRRLKKNIQHVGKAGNGLNIYAYQYIWGGPTMLGYMADEVQKVAPGAVTTVGGLKMVNYEAV